MSIRPIVSSAKPVGLIGGGPVARSTVEAAKPFISSMIAADGGANAALKFGISLSAVLGDLDSLSDHARATFGSQLHHVAELDTTDFEKVMARVDAPGLIAMGCTGGRMDHALSVLNVMARFRSIPVILVDQDDASFLAPEGCCMLDLPIGCRLSVMPLAKAMVTLTGVRWPFARQRMHPAGFTSPSNEVTGRVQIEAEGPVLLILPQHHLDQAVTAAFPAR